MRLTAVLSPNDHYYWLVNLLVTLAFVCDFQNWDVDVAIGGSYRLESDKLVICR